MLHLKCLAFHRIVAIALGLLIAVVEANAQYGSPSYSGGSYTMFGFMSFPYGVSGGEYGGGTWGGTCSGQITATFTWAGDPDALPPAVLVEETCYAYTFNQLSNGVTSAGSADNDLQDGTVTSNYSQGNPPLSYQSKTSGKDNNGVTIKHYRVIQNPSSTIELHISPTSSCSGNSPGSAVVWYAATVTPIDIVFQGGIGDNWEKRYLIGQRVKATLDCALTPDVFDWGASGGSPFDEFQITATTGHLIAAGPQEFEEFSECFSREGALELSLTTHLLVPSGAKPANGLNVTIARDFSMERPTYTPDEEAIGTFGLNGGGDGYALSGNFQETYPEGQAVFGIRFRAKLAVPSGFSNGYWNWAQTINVNCTRVVSGVTQHLGTNPGGYTQGHDASYPYNTVNPPYDINNTYWSTGNSNKVYADAVGERFDQTLPQALTASPYTIHLSFKTYAMFLPPGSDSEHVPVRELNWHLDGTFTRSGGTWTGSGLGQGITLQTDNASFPDWDHIISAASMVYS